MSAEANQFPESLRVKLAQFKTQLDGVTDDLKAIHADDKAAIQARLRTARTGMENGRHHLKDAEDKASSWLKAKEAAGETVIQGWKDKHESRKLAHHAERAEANADAAILLAADAVSGAVLAAYEALDARMAAASVTPARDTRLM